MDLFRIGFRRELEIEDIWDIPSHSASEKLGKKLLAAWEVELFKAKPSLTAAVIHVFRGRFFALLLLSIFNWLIK